MARMRRTKDSVRLFLQTRSIDSFQDALDAAKPRPSAGGTQADKKNYAQRLSAALSVLVANRLRPTFHGITPLSDGTRQESKARTGKGVKKLDVNYSTPDLGLALGISAKTLNFRDPGSKRYTKNATRIDNELRAEASDYHQRQPFAVLAGVVFVPIDSCDDGNPERKTSKSSFAQIVDGVLKHRAKRGGPEGHRELFECIYVGLYDHTTEPGSVVFFNVADEPPSVGRPTARKGLEVGTRVDPLRDLEGMLKEIVAVYDARNP